jgi:hypothetical protein
MSKDGAIVVSAETPRGQPRGAPRLVEMVLRARPNAYRGKRARPAAALTSAEVKTPIAVCHNDVAGVRDHALQLIGLAGALRRSDLVAIDHDQGSFEANHLRLTNAGQPFVSLCGLCSLFVRGWVANPG